MVGTPPVSAGSDLAKGSFFLDAVRWVGETFPDALGLELRTPETGSNVKAP
jgi:hypothetical protein